MTIPTRIPNAVNKSDFPRVFSLHIPPNAHVEPHSISYLSAIGQQQDTKARTGVVIVPMLHIEKNGNSIANCNWIVANR